MILTSNHEFKRCIKTKQIFPQIQSPPSLEEVGQVEEIITGLLQCQDEAIKDMDRSDDDTIVRKTILLA